MALIRPCMTMKLATPHHQEPSMSGNAQTRRAAIGGAALSIASARSLAALAAPRVVGTGLETGAIRAIGVETARTDYRGRPALRATALENAPGLDRLVMLDTPAFGVSWGHLKDERRFMSRLFGTDGVRGVANRDLTAELALALGSAAARRLCSTSGAGRCVAVVGRDPRPRSSPASRARASTCCGSACCRPPRWRT